MTRRHALAPAGFSRSGWLIAIGALYAVYCLLQRNANPITAPDSEGYLAFWPIHTLGYPLFLKVTGGGATIVQPIVFAATLVWLGIEILALSASLPLAAIVMLAAIATPGLVTYHLTILTESLFVSGSVALLAVVIRFIRKPSWQAAATAGVIVAVSATVRRTGLAFIPIPLLMIWLEWRWVPISRAAVVAAALAPMLAILGGERIAAQAIHGNRAGSLMGVHVFAKAALVEAPSSEFYNVELARLNRFLAVSAAPIRAVIARAPEAIRGQLTVYYETCLQLPCLDELRGGLPQADPGLNSRLFVVGWDRLAGSPLAYLELTARHYRSFWTIFNLQHPDTAPALTAFIAANRPLPFERQAFHIEPGDVMAFRGMPMVRYAQWAATVIEALTLVLAGVGIGAALLQRPLAPPLAVACLAAVTAQAALLFSALVAAGISRFIVVLWPVLTASVCLFVWWLAGSAAMIIGQRNH